MKLAPLSVALAALAAVGCGGKSNTLTAHHCPTKVRLFFRTSASPEKVAAITRHVREMDTVGSVRFVSRAEALREMRAKYPDLFYDLPRNPLPSSLEIQPKDRDHPNQVVTELRPLPPAVERVKAPSLRLCLAAEKLRKLKHQR